MYKLMFCTFIFAVLLLKYCFLTGNQLQRYCGEDSETTHWFSVFFARKGGQLRSDLGEISDPAYVTVGYDELTSFVATELIDRQIQAPPDSEVHVHADEVPETLREVTVWSLSVSDCIYLCELDRHL